MTWQTDGRPMRLLLIEDDPGDALIVEELLADASLPADVTWCRTMEHADAELSHGHDCVLLDLGLPDTEGLIGVRKVMGAAPESAVVVLTGFDDVRTGVAAVGEGAQDYLIKSRLDSELLSRAIRYAVQRKRTQEADRRLHEVELLTAENQRLERGLLPRPLLLDGSVNIASRYRPGREQTLLGGDFFDVVQAADGTVYAMVGDVCGHGPDEAALGVCLRIAWRSLVLAGVRGEDLMRVLEQLCVAEQPSPGVYATMCIAEIAADRSAAILTSAGHPEPVLLSDGTASLCEVEHGMPVGLLPELSAWKTTKVRLPDRGGLLLYTDGLIECFAANEGIAETAEMDARLGTEGLVRLSKGLSDEGDPDEFLGRLLDRVLSGDGGRNRDDLAMLYVAWDRR
jgi:serine phosphatase RsbU (regulator of sigma subunit)